MKLLIQILFFVLAIFQTNISQAKVTLFKFRSSAYVFNKNHFKVKNLVNCVAISLFILNSCNSNNKSADVIAGKPVTINPHDSINFFLYNEVEEINSDKNVIEGVIQRFRINIVNSSKIDTFHFLCFNDSQIYDIESERKIRHGNKSDWIYLESNENLLLFLEPHSPIYENVVLPNQSKNVYYQTGDNIRDFTRTDSIKYYFGGEFKDSTVGKSKMFKYGENLNGIKLE